MAATKVTVFVKVNPSSTPLSSPPSLHLQAFTSSFTGLKCQEVVVGISKLSLTYDCTFSSHSNNHHLCKILQKKTSHKMKHRHTGGKWMSADVKCKSRLVPPSSIADLQSDVLNFIDIIWEDTDINSIWVRQRFVAYCCRLSQSRIK